VHCIQSTRFVCLLFFDKAVRVCCLNGSLSICKVIAGLPHLYLPMQGERSQDHLPCSWAVTSASCVMIYSGHTLVGVSKHTQRLHTETSKETVPTQPQCKPVFEWYSDKTYSQREFSCSAGMGHLACLSQQHPTLALSAIVLTLLAPCLSWLRIWCTTSTTVDRPSEVCAASRCLCVCCMAGPACTK